MTTLATIRDFKSADALLKNRDSRKLANNTYLVRRGGKIAVQLHATDVVTFHPDGAFTLTTGGYDTMTTRDRLNNYSPAQVYRLKGDTFASVNGKSYRFHDGITFGPRGGCRNPLSERKVSKQDSAKAAMNKRIEQYIDGWIETLVTGQMPLPSGGDCWYCAMFPETKGGETFHLTDHMEEGYFVPSLLLKALTAKGYPNLGVAVQFICGIAPTETGLDGSRADLTEIRKVLRWFMRKHLA